MCAGVSLRLDALVVAAELTTAVPNVNSPAIPATETTFNVRHGAGRSLDLEIA
ncbi:MAG: hypothetical protein ACYCST_18500 [Acidimicrobiales bacterium]